MTQLSSAEAQAVEDIIGKAREQLLLESPERRLVRLLKERGMEDSAARDLMRWVIDEEERVSQSGDPLAFIQWNLTLGRKYIEVGGEDRMYGDWAYDYFMAALIAAEGEQRWDIAQEIADEMDKIASS